MGKSRLIKVLVILSWFWMFFPLPLQGQVFLSSNDNLEDTIEEGLLKKNIQPIKFRENKLRKEKESIYDLIRNLTDSEDLTIDSLTVNLIMEDLLRGSNDSSQSWEEIQKIQDELIGLIDTLDFESANRKEILKKLVQLKAVQIKCDPKMAPSEGKAINDSTFLCLTTKAKVFGWQDANLDPNVIPNYNFDYLTDIIYNGYELGPDGKAKNEKLLNNFLIDSTLATLVQENRIKLSLSIFSKSATDISTFLSSKNAMETLISNIKAMQEEVPIEGINIYFENFSEEQKQNFTEFISRVRKSLQSENENFMVTVSLPAISNPKDLENAKAYDLKTLMELADYFLIQTDKIKLLNDEFPGPPSPLYTIGTEQSQSIESTLDYYGNGKIPLRKMVMTVSYLGITWPVSDFMEGSKADGLGKYMSFKEIKEYFGALEKFEKVPVFGFDPIMGSSYFQYFEKGKRNILWFEDENSLYQKYNYALDQELGGVAIWGLGYDEGYVELWDALGAAMVKVDTVIVSKKTLESEKESYWDGFWTAKDFGTVLLIFMVIGGIIGIFLFARKK